MPRTRASADNIPAADEYPGTSDCPTDCRGVTGETADGVHGPPRGDRRWAEGALSRLCRHALAHVSVPFDPATTRTAIIHPQPVDVWVWPGTGRGVGSPVLAEKQRGFLNPKRVIVFSF